MKDQAAYDACNFDGASLLGEVSGTKAKVEGSDGDVHYFSCKVDTHCKMGQKLAVTVGTPTKSSTASSGAMSARVGAALQVGCTCSGHAGRGRWRVHAQRGTCMAGMQCGRCAGMQP